MDSIISNLLHTFTLGPFRWKVIRSKIFMTKHILYDTFDGQWVVVTKAEFDTFDLVAETEVAEDGTILVTKYLVDNS